MIVEPKTERKLFIGRYCTWISCRISHIWMVLPQTISSAIKKVWKGILSSCHCAFEPSTTKLQRPWVSPTTSLCRKPTNMRSKVLLEAKLIQKIDKYLERATLRDQRSRWFQRLMAEGTWRCILTATVSLSALYYWLESNEYNQTCECT